MPGGVARQAVVAGGVADLLLWPMTWLDRLLCPIPDPDAMADGSFQFPEIAMSGANHGISLAELEKMEGRGAIHAVDELVWQLLSGNRLLQLSEPFPAEPGAGKPTLRMLFERARQYEETSYEGPVQLHQLYQQAQERRW